ncbi:hypothetical protein FKW77_007358 [Venturia effusa]|uniref:Ribosomal protein L1 n=1 Tax=Venturia effusa TaxID=50376 RepID=A0A517LB56_9PEZI|nr:hypothetical protein FKW77_007358 [Venturia effusa]
MSKGEVAVTVRQESGTPYALNPNQTLRAAVALLKAIEKTQKEIDTTKQQLLADDEADENSTESPIWLVMTAKKHITDKARLKPGKIHLPHPLWTSDELRICLITADPPAENVKAYKDLVKNVAFPDALKPRIAKVVAVSKLKTKYKPYEARRKLLAEYDIFLADDRVINLLPGLLGKVFYKNTTKRPIPVSLTGHEKWHGQGRQGEAGKLKRKREKDSGGPTMIGRPEHVGEDIEKALHGTLVHLAPSVTTAVRVAWGAWTPEKIAANTAAVVDGMASKYIPKGWRGIKSIHIKGPDTIALPIWLADELWVDEDQVLDQDTRPEDEFNKKRKKRKAVTGTEEVAEPVKALQDGQPPAKKSKTKKEKSEKDLEEAREAAERKQKLKEEKAAARKEAEKVEAGDTGKDVKKTKKVKRSAITA